MTFFGTLWIGMILLTYLFMSGVTEVLSEKMAAVCIYNNEECLTENCNNELCDKRHPHRYRYFEKYGKCKFR